MEIKLDNVCTRNLTNINTEFLKNQITSLIGSNDSGKNELLNVIYGLEKILSGTIKYGRKTINMSSKKSEVDLIKKDIYFLKEDYTKMLFNINIREDIKFYVDKYNEDKLLELLKLFNLDDSILEKNYLELSNSEIKKILLIIGLIIDLKVIILDNPTIGLDNKSIQTLIKQLKKIKRENKIIIIASHNTNFLLEISDTITVLNDNKIIEKGSKFEILSNEYLLNKINLKLPNVINFVNKVKQLKNIKLSYKDNINDLIKEIFRHAN